MRRRVAIPLLLAVLLLVAAILVYVRLPVWSAAVVSRDLSTFFHRPVTTGAVRYQLFPPQAEIDDLRVAGATPDAEPFLEARRITAVASLRPLWRRRLVLSSLRLQGLKIRIHAFEPEGDDIPRRLCPIHQGNFKQEARRALDGILSRVGRKILDIFK